MTARLVTVQQCNDENIIVYFDADVIIRAIRDPNGPQLEYLLGLAIAVDGAPGSSALACDTDGIDGTEDAAGAIVVEDTLERARRLLLPKNDRSSDTLREHRRIFAALARRDADASAAAMRAHLQAGNAPLQDFAAERPEMFEPGGKARSGTAGGGLKRNTGTGGGTTARHFAAAWWRQPPCCLALASRRRSSTGSPSM